MAYTNPENMTGIADIFSYANNVSDGIFGIGILISLYVVILGYLNMRGENIMDCFVVSGYITSITSIFIFLLGLINGWHLFFTFVITIISILWSYYSKGG